MKNQKYNEPTNTVLTDRMDVNSDEFNQFQALLLNKSKTQTTEQKRNIELIALQFQMEDYLDPSKNDEFRLAGEFLRSFLTILNIRQNKFASYIGIRPSNLSKLLNGKRPINSELALIFGKIFNLDPMLWLEIQSKNELMKLSRKKGKQLKKYSIDDLLNEKVH